MDGIDDISESYFTDISCRVLFLFRFSFMLRMKEYERERRLMERAKRKQLREGNSPEKMLSE